MSQEQDAIGRGRGKWGQAGVPHKGWVCVGEYDTFVEHGEDEFETCGMCESAQVRLSTSWKTIDIPSSFGAVASVPGIWPKI